MKRALLISTIGMCNRFTASARAVRFGSRVRSNASHARRRADQERREIHRQRNSADRGRPEDIHQHREAGRQCYRNIQPCAPDGDDATKSLSAVSFALNLLDGAEPRGQHLRQFKPVDKCGQYGRGREHRIPAGIDTTHRPNYRVWKPKPTGTATDCSARSYRRS